MTGPTPHWATTFAFRWVIAFLAHAAALHVLAGSGTISQAFSPGDHVSRATLVIIGMFLVLRVYVMLLWPAALISLFAWLYQRRRGVAPHPATRSLR